MNARSLSIISANGFLTWYLLVKGTVGKALKLIIWKCGLSASGIMLSLPLLFGEATDSRSIINIIILQYPTYFNGILLKVNKKNVYLDYFINLPSIIAIDYVYKRI